MIPIKDYKYQEISLEAIRTLWKANEAQLKECERVTETSIRGESYYANDGHPGNEKINDFRLAFFKEMLYRDALTNGFTMTWPHGTVIMQGLNGGFFRGENQLYSESVASIYRDLYDRAGEDPKNSNEIKAYKFVRKMRIAEFELFLRNLYPTKLWEDNEYTVLYEALAQHYGLKTEWLDITSDFKVALFFATCTWDDENKKWRPLTKEDTEQKPEKQYGIIFNMPKVRTQFNSAMLYSAGDFKGNVVLPIGYQPFMRCHMQHAYGIHMKNEPPLSLQQDTQFNKLIFRHDEKLSKAVFKEMDGGRKIYPNEWLPAFDDIFRQIRKTNTFSENAFQMVLDQDEIYHSEAEAREALKEFYPEDVAILLDGEKPDFHISRQRIRACNRRYKGKSVTDLCGLEDIFSRLCYAPPGNDT